MLSDVARLASFEEGERKSVEDLFWASEVADHCTDPCKVVINIKDQEPEKLNLSKKEVTQHLVAAKNHLAQLAVALLDPKVEVRGEKAIVRGTGRGMGRSPGRTDYFLESHSVEIELVRLSGGWKLSSITNLDPINLDEE
jgi:hypothetical protein